MLGFIALGVIGIYVLFLILKNTITNDALDYERPNKMIYKDFSNEVDNVKECADMSDKLYFKPDRLDDQIDKLKQELKQEFMEDLQLKEKEKRIKALVDEFLVEKTKSINDELLEKTKKCEKEAEDFNLRDISVWNKIVLKDRIIYLSKDIRQIVFGICEKDYDIVDKIAYLAINSFDENIPVDKQITNFYGNKTDMPVRVPTLCKNISKMYITYSNHCDLEFNLSAPVARKIFKYLRDTDITDTH